MLLWKLMVSLFQSVSSTESVEPSCSYTQAWVTTQLCIFILYFYISITHSSQYLVFGIHSLFLKGHFKAAIIQIIFNRFDNVTVQTFIFVFSGEVTAGHEDHAYQICRLPQHFNNSK